MRLHIGKAFNSLKLTDYLEQEEDKCSQNYSFFKPCTAHMGGIAFFEEAELEYLGP